MKITQCFLVNIAIIEGRRYAMMNMDSAVHVRVGNEKRVTGIQKNSDCPYYNEYFVFEFNITLQELLDKNITLTVIQPKKIWRRRKILGYFYLDVATVWSQKEHLFYHKWAVLNAPTQENISGPRGYLKLNISVVTKGEIPNLPTKSADASDEIEGNLLLPEGISVERQRASFIFKIYSADIVPRFKKNMSNKEYDTISKVGCYVKISFAGLTGKTHVEKNNLNPIWNTKIELVELFPPLCQRVKIELKFEVTGCGNSLKSAQNYLNINSISNPEEKGFLPTFGPDFLYMYTTDNEETYAGKIFMEMTTEVLDDIGGNIKIVKTRPVEMPNESEQKWNMESVFLFCTIYSAAMIDKKYKDKEISFEISIGNSKDMDTDSESTEKCYTESEKPLSDPLRLYYYMPYTERKPCLSVVSYWPDARIRLFRMNRLSKIYNSLKTELDIIEQRLEEISDYYLSLKNEIDKNKLNSISDQLIYDCQTFVTKVAVFADVGTTLDQYWVQYVIEEMKIIERKAIRVKELLITKLRKPIRKLFSIKKRLQNLLDDEALDCKFKSQTMECWPDVVITMMEGENKIGVHWIPVKDIIFSNDVNERGIKCGVIHNATIQPLEGNIKLFSKKSAIACIMDIQVWIGLESEQGECFKTIPSFYRYPLPTSSADLVPTSISTDERYFYECRVYILQGRFVPGADGSGLADPFARIIFQAQVKQTKIKDKTLYPVWDQIIFFHNVLLDGTRKYIENKPPTITIEIYDLDTCKKVEYIGSTVFSPKVVWTDEGDIDDYSVPKICRRQIINGNSELVGEILLTAVLIPFSDFKNNVDSPKYDAISIPDSIKPNKVQYRIDILFWGLRDLRKVGICHFTKPRIIVDCAGSILNSSTINYKKAITSCNFTHPYKTLLIELPEDKEYFSPLAIKLYDNRSFGRNTFLGINMSSIYDALFYPITKRELIEQMGEEFYVVDNKEKNSSSETDSSLENFNIKNASQRKIHKILVEKKNEHIRKNQVSMEPGIRPKHSKNILNAVSDMFPKKKTVDFVPERIDSEAENLDWWTKFYGSLSNVDHDSSGNITESKPMISKRFKLKIYSFELEFQKDFDGFDDNVKSYPIYRGKRTGDDILDEDNIIAVFKGAIRLYRWPQKETNEEYVTVTGLPIENGAFQDWPDNDNQSFLVRVYIVRGLNLRPLDYSGKSDPYCCVMMGNQIIHDMDNSIPNKVNPVFGRCFELKGTLPFDNVIKISIWDKDIGNDDMIGETKIDIEKRFYTKHRAICGLPLEYVEIGACKWRDLDKPSKILSKLCKKWKLQGPTYVDKSVQVGPCIFENDKEIVGPSSYKKEVLSLLALHRWKEIPFVGCVLVPEHVETRSLYHPKQPGIEQGKIQMWLDVFAIRDLPPPPVVDITPQLPVEYELRVIIWNTDEVILDEDSFFLGERKSDIYVKGWLVDPEESQNTDVHYNSITGEGNFNWRFVFPFNYVANENKLVVYKKESIFSNDFTETKMPCKLTLQVWDNDTFSRDDFLGTLTLELAKLPRAAKTASLCKLENLNSKEARVNLFKTRRHRGWWPFKGENKHSNKHICTGKVEAELELYIKKDGEFSHVGLGREDPQPLPPPNRPDISFAWWRNPMKSAKYLIKRKKCLIFKLVIFIIMVLMFVLGLYALPGYTVKRLLGA